MKALNILLADDSPSVGQFVSEYLRGSGHTVTYVQSGEEAVAAYRGQAFNLVLMDVVMPGMGGLEAVKQIKAIPTTNWVPVIIITGLDSEDDILGGFMAGADDYIFKPIKPLTLDIRIRSMMRIAAIQKSTASIVDSVDEGIIQIDRVGRICRFNRAAERIFGYTETEVLGKNVSMLMPLPDKERHDDYLANFAATGERKIIGIGRRVTGLRRNGETFAMHLGISEANTPDGKYFVGMVRDLTVEESLHEEIANNERFMRLLVDVLPGMVGYWTHDLRCGFANRSYFEWFGKKSEDIPGIHIKDLMGEELFKKNEPYILAALRGEKQSFERTLAKHDGSTGYMWVHYIPDLEGERVRGFFVLASDITELKVSEQALRENRRFMSDLIENSGTLIFAKDMNGRYTLVNRQYEEATGMRREDVLGRTDGMLHPEALAKRFRERDIAVMTSGKPTEDEGEVPEPSGMRTYLTVKFPLRDEDGSVNGVCGIATDITERKKLQQEMERMAQTDLLTNLPNRRHFMSMAELEVSRTVRYGGELSVLMLDIDHFKNINDTYGHKAGDIVLEKIGALCKQALRDVDIVGRIGGEEFAFLLPQTDREHAVQVAERLRNTIAEAEIAIEGEQSLPVTVSIGVSAYAGTATNIAVLLNQADQLLYEAKRSGRNRVCADERC